MFFKVLTPLIYISFVLVTLKVSAQKEAENLPVTNGTIKNEIKKINLFIDTTTSDTHSIKHAKVLLRLARLQEYIGQTEESETTINNALDIFSSYNYQKGIADCLDLIGELYRTQKNLEKALLSHLKALEIYTNIHAPKGIFYAKNNLAINYRQVGNYKKSEKYLMEVLNEENKSGIDSADFILIYNSLAILFEHKNDHKKSAAYYRRGLRLNPKTYKQKERYGGLINNYGNYFRLQKNYDSAEYYYRKSFKYNTLHKYQNSIGVNYANFAIINRARGRLDSALYYHLKSLEVVKKTNFNQIVQDNYFHLASIYTELKDYEKALYYQTKYSKFRDSTFAIKDAQKLTEIEINLANKEKNIKETLLQNEINKKELLEQKYNYRVRLYIYIIVFLFILLALGFFLFRARSRSRKHLNELNEALEERVIERTLNLSYEIDRHKKTEQELKQNEERWNKAQEVGKIGNWEYDLETHTLWGSMQAFKILRLNHKKSPIYTNHILHKVHKDDLKRVVRAIRRIKRSDKKIHLEFRLQTKGLKQTFVLIRAEMIYSVDLKPIKISGTVQDITYRKIVENELVKARDKAEESDRLKSAFLSNMSHEIRTPMNAIIGFSDLLGDPAYDSRVRKEYIKLIQSNCNKLLNLIDDIIDIAKIEANQIQIKESNCVLNDMLDELYTIYQRETNQNLKLILSKPEYPENPIIKTDAFRLQQVIINLMNNAIKFTDEGKIEFGYVLKNNNLEFFVKDTGIGISQESQKLIFERFRQADNSSTRLYGGTGLGLAISKYIIKMMDGKIWVHSKKGEGSQFYFTIPFKPANRLMDENNNDQEETELSITNWKHKTVLIAEDEEDSYQLLKTILGKTNINILHAKTGKEALESLEKNPEIDLILMDIQMPEMDGLEATKEIKSRNIEIPIIAQTAFAMPGEKEKCDEAGCDDYITKPINKNKLLKLLSDYLEN